MDILRVFLESVRNRITPLWTKFQLWRRPGYIRSRLLGLLQKLFQKILDVRPRHPQDYYPVFGWLISKKLALAVLTGAGLFSAYYVLEMNAASFLGTQGEPVRTFSYDDILLRFTDGRVRILGKSGYLAYEGSVSAGSASGEGTLYDPEGEVVYRGGFEESRYQGEGTLYDSGGQMRYRGGFLANLYEGEGSLYGENGSPAYQGNFSRGEKEGGGTLYDAGGHPVYRGMFSRGQLVYSELPGKSSQETAEQYTGRRTVYLDTDTWAVCMHEIDAVSYGAAESGRLDETVTAEGIYVLHDYLYEDGERLEKVEQLERYFGPAGYEGNSAVTMPEAVVIENLRDQRNRTFGKAAMETEAVFADVLEVLSYDTDYVIYLYSYEREGLLYTFYSRDRLGGFEFYRIEAL